MKKITYTTLTLIWVISVFILVGGAPGVIYNSIVASIPVVSWIIATICHFMKVGKNAK